MANNELFGIPEQLDCSDCVNHGGDWECDYVQCHKGTDTISRKAALDVLHGYFDGMLDTDTVCPKDLYNEFEALPSAQPGEDIRAMCGECDAWNQYKNYPQPGWILTSERLPKTEEKVSVTCEHLDIYGKPHRYVCKAYHVDRYTMRSDVGWWDEGCDEYCEEDDQYYVLEGWYEYIHNWGDYSAVRITEDKVVAWCPLQEPYKDGEHEKAD